ncbi:hypothetical protein [Halococcus thailandensis]|uniref:Uncharacterized protein n=1 Tax=Halococcus thailandensis JCM 13552 TaxID=1227457 RepID=M0MVA8_9EURY|nr:hypothetical protein [Halococcus thailandensis]EMA49273.1 hypothetical protein C451_19406 [Halococcus thailandensis JCM 13552]
MNDVDPIIVAGDDGMILDESSESEGDRATLNEFGIIATDGGAPVGDGPVTCREDGDGLAIHVDPDSELGERLSWIAGHRGMSDDELLADAIQQFID